LTNTAWSEFLYHYSEDPHTIEVVYGEWTSGTISTPFSLFDCDETIQDAYGNDIECIKAYYLDEGTGSEIEYTFDHF